MSSTINRRCFLHTSAFVAASRILGQPIFAQQSSVPDRLSQQRSAAANARITTQPIRGNIHVLLGAGGNIAVLPGRDGKILVDSGYRTARPQLTEALNAVNQDPITHLVDSHWHADHTDGNDWMHTQGATIIAHENTRTRLSTTQRVAAFDMTVPPQPPGGIPSIVFTSEHTLHLNGETLHLSHYTPAHTDSDISILFTGADVLHTGDTFFNGMYPFIDYSSGGNIDGMITAAARNLSAASATTIIIPGHGPVGTRAQLQHFHDMLAGVRDTVASLKKQGRTADEITAAKPTSAFDTNFKPGPIPVDVFIRLVYQGV